MKPKYILALDQGTTGSRAFLFDERGAVVLSAYKEFKQYFPGPGWVEHDAQEIWRSCVFVINGVIKRSGISAAQIAAIGITNQRETTVLWDRRTSKPVARAIVWQCRRTADTCKELRAKGLERKFKHKTGLVLDPYFSGTKIKWFLDHVPGLRGRGRKNEIAFGTIDSWLIWKLTGGRSHVTDFTNASRTLIFNIRELKWDKELLNILDIPAELLPRVQPSGSVFGVTDKNAEHLPSGIPIASAIGDQQAALYGQGCYAPGTIKNTYGTGCFLVLNTGSKLVHSQRGLLTTIACDRRGGVAYAMEGSVFIAGAVVQWLRDEMKLIKKSSDIERAIRGLKDTCGVYLVPAFAGLGAPYWDSEARGLICGLTRGANAAHIMRAGLESIAYQTKDVYTVMEKEWGEKIKELRVDGGACKNNFLMQFQADVLGAKIIRPRMIESTAKGAAQLAGITVGLWKQKDLAKLQMIEKIFSPRMNKSKVDELYKGWLNAVAKARR